MPTIEELRQATYKTWETIAPTWAKRRDFVDGVSAPVEAWMLEALDPKPGQTVLELACGTGQSSLSAAEAVKPDGRVLATDFSPAMLEQARARATETGAGNIEHRVLDAQEMDLGDDSVDGVLCRFGYMLMPDPASALAETRRVLRPGGHLALAVWGPPERNPFFAIGGGSLVLEGHMDPPDPSLPGVFNMASEERTRALVETAGFEQVRVEEIPVQARFGSVDEYLEVVLDTAGQLAMALRGLSAEELDAVKGRMEEGFSSFAADGGYEVPGVAFGATGS